MGRNLKTKLHVVTQLHKYSAKLTDVVPVFLNTAGFPYTVWRRMENRRLRIRENEKWGIENYWGVTKLKMEEWRWGLPDWG